MAAVSVLLPCFDAEPTLGEALESLWAQSFADFEIIAVDDGSTDGTASVLASHARREPRLRIVTTPHRGIAPALAAAAAASEAPLVARMDADDIAHAERLERQVAHLETHRGLSVSSSRVQVFPREALREGYLRYEAWLNDLLAHEDILRSLFVESPLPHPTVMMRREALVSVGGYRDVGWPEDYDLWMRLAHAGHRFEKLPEVLLSWRDAPRRASRTSAVYSAERFIDVKEYYLARHVVDDERRLAIWGAGPIGKMWARRLRPRYLIELDPRKIGQRIHGALVVGVDALPSLGDAYIVVAVGALSRSRGRGAPYRAAREEIRERLADAGLIELRDFVCVA